MAKKILLIIPIMFFTACLTWKPNLNNKEYCTLVFQVEVPPGTSEDDAVFVAGNSPSLGDWKPDGLPLAKSADGFYTGKISAEKGKNLEFKITRGSWMKEAIYEDMQVPQNSLIKVERDDTIRICVKTWKDLLFSKNTGGITGQVEYIRNFASEFLRPYRDIIIWLPPSYQKNPQERFPVLYMHDGQNIIDPSTSFLGIDWKVDEVTDSLIKAGRMREIIIVGIYNSPDRSAEYSPREKGGDYGKMLMEEIKPMIDSRYRTLPGRDYTAVMGSSMGGLISLHLLLTYPDKISMAGCLSPAFLVHNREIIKRVKKMKNFPENIKIYLDCGSAELDEKLLPGMREMAELLSEKGLFQDRDLLVKEFPGAVHNEAAWSQRIHIPLLFFFGYKK